MHIITVHVDEPVSIFDTPHLDWQARNRLRERLADDLGAVIGGTIAVDILPIEDDAR